MRDHTRSPDTQDDGESNIPLPDHNDHHIKSIEKELRACIQEEVHGVRCMNPEETPELLRNSLSRLARILDSDDVIPRQNKRAYLASQQLDPSTYVNTDAFRLMFLRSELFDVPKAARTLTNFLNLSQKVFGPFVLERPIRLDDFDKKELRLLRKGLVQYLPFRDRSGRRVMVVFMNDDFTDIHANMRLKIFLYMLYSAGTNDIDSQRKGVVTVLWGQTANGFRTSSALSEDAVSARTQLREARPLRASAIHMCFADTPIFRLIQKMVTTIVGEPTSTLVSSPALGSSVGGEAPFRSVGSRFRIHLGEPIELQYALQSYGISADRIPITLSSTIKLNYFHQWLWIRQYVEQGLSIVECPGLYDVLVRQGTAAMYHPGNAWFLDLIQSKFEAHMLLVLQKRGKNTTGGRRGGLDGGLNIGSNHQVIIDNFKLTPNLLESFASELVQSINDTSGRILTWYDNKGYGCVGWWTVLENPQQVYSKVEYMVGKEYKKLISSITKEHRANQKRKEPLPRAMRVQQVLESDTSIFRSQDGRSTGRNPGDGCGSCGSLLNPNYMDIDDGDDDDDNRRFGTPQS